jgi:hypothetical protein
LKSLPLSPLNSGRLIHSGKFSSEAGDCDCLVEAYSSELINPHQMGQPKLGRETILPLSVWKRQQFIALLLMKNVKNSACCYYCNKSYLFEG